MSYTPQLTWYHTLAMYIKMYPSTLKVIHFGWITHSYVFLRTLPPVYGLYHQILERNRFWGTKIAFISEKIAFVGTVLQGETHTLEIVYKPNAHGESKKKPQAQPPHHTLITAKTQKQTTTKIWFTNFVGKLLKTKKTT